MAYDEESLVRPGPVSRVDNTTTRRRPVTTREFGLDLQVNRNGSRTLAKSSLRVNSKSMRRTRLDLTERSDASLYPNDKTDDASFRPKEKPNHVSLHPNDQITRSRLHPNDKANHA